MVTRRGSLLLIIALFAIFLAAYALVLRPWHMRWGATDSEIAMSMPGDAYIPAHTVVSTRALTIADPPDMVWPWIVQLGQGRGGFYSYTWLENLFAADMHNADEIRPELQQLKVGDHISFQRNGPSTKVAYIEEGRALVAEGGWTWYLVPAGVYKTRLIVRYASFPVTDPVSAVFYYAIFEPAHFVMEAGMMAGIDQRATVLAQEMLMLPVYAQEGRWSR